MAGSRLAGIRSFFEPRSVAVVGVSDDREKLSSIIYANMLANRRKGLLRAPVYPVNPAHDMVGSRRCYRGFSSLPETPELVVIAVPASKALQVVRDSARAGAKAAVLITGGFAETGRRELEREVLEAARGSGMRLLGPNTIGLLDTFSGVDSLFLRPTKVLPTGRKIVSLLKPLRGGVVVITQSGHLGEIVSEELTACGVGLRALIGTGNQVDVSAEDIVGYFADDERCKVIAVYLEGVRDGRRFMEMAARAARSKPVVAFKMGKTRAGARAALTHTASLVGDYDVYRVAFRQSGVIETRSLQELLDYCVSLSLLKPARGRRLLISTNAGGVGAVAADEAESEGLKVEPLGRAARAVRARSDGTGIASGAALGNPLDLTATVSTEFFVDATAAALSSGRFDLAVVLPTHQTPAIGPDISERMAKALLASGRPACVSVMGRSPLAQMVHLEFLRRGIPSFPTPERAVRAVAVLPAYSEARSRAAAPSAPSGKDRLGFLKGEAQMFPAQAVEKVMAAYGIPVPRSALLEGEGDLAEAGGLDYPVACKLASLGLVHKTDAGGVILNVRNARELAASAARLRGLASRLRVPFGGILVQEMAPEGVELLVGSTRDPVFGPTIVFGTGGKYAEVMRDYALAIAPVSISGARDLISRTKARSLLGGYRGGPRVDLTQLAAIVSRFSRILAENPSIEQIEANPLIASASGLAAVDVRAMATRR